ncbi:ABC transporter permease subunit [Kribbella shirazensis]|uniref:ABC-type transport system involved in multi-copper enzyme maturation permease subunit n=1 Tax=Kribbella shirazensis TaxID=1105143 RepID=A0A7X5V8U8_9ACTN|nr:ABC transporter permease subunit [Kribbella shirazensis]NIK56739.1 ABC-type transport system involved in multi-copper enzyme maturation permease subunit [Kribbella shirazensis]
MIWLTWRQFRVQFLVVAVVILAAGIALAATGPGLQDDYRRLADGFIKNLGFQRLNPLLYVVGQALLYAVPPVVGAFWGAPLIARELETGTHRLVWAQSISRRRWLATKVGIGGLAVIGISGLLSLAVTWWADPIDDALNAGQDSNIYLPRMFPAVFSARGLVPVGYAVFAFALGVALGLVIRRTVVALAVTLAVVILVQILTPMFVRPQLMAPTDKSIIASAENIRGFMISGPGPDPEVKKIEVATDAVGAWKLSDETVDRSGKALSTLPSWTIDCEPGPPPNGSQEKTSNPKRDACFQRLADEGYRQHVRYFTADTFWALQWREFGLFLLLALGLTGFSFWRIRRDLS